MFSQDCTAGSSPAVVPAAPDPAQVAGAVDRYMALREFRARLYRCLTARADALFELCDAILCADHAVTSLAELSLVPEFRRGHGALYDALAAGRIDEEALAALLAGTLPQLIDGDEGRAWAGEHDTIDHGLLEHALAGVPAADAAQVREACARWGRLRFAIDATPYPRPDAECSPERGHVHHDACRCDSTRKTIPGWEYQFTAALGHLRTAWAALIDVERTTPAGRTRQTARQVKNLLRRLHAAGNGGHGAPLVIMDAGYSAAALTAALTRQPVHLLIRLASGSVFYADPVTWPGKKGRPGKHGMPVTCHNNPGQASPEPDETLMLPDTPRYGTVRVSAWRGVHPLIHGDRGYFAGWDGDLPVLRGTVLRVIVARLPDGRAPHKTMWLWHAGPAPLSLDELWRAYLARFDEEHAFKFAKGTLGLTAAKVRTPQQADRWVRLVMAAGAQLLIARPHTAGLRRPWETRPPACPCPRAGSAADLKTSAGSSAPPPMSLNPPGPAPDGQKAPPAGRHPATQSRRKPATQTKQTGQPPRKRLKPKLRQQDDLAENVALRESPVGVLDPVERERRRDGQLQLAGRDQAREFGEHARGGRGRVALGVDPVPCDGLEVDDRVDAGRLHAEFEGQLHVARPERVDERVHLASRLPDPVRHPVAVGHRDDTVPGQPRVVSLAGQPDHGGTGLPGQLDRDRADPARRSGDRHRVAPGQADRPDRGVRGGPGHEQRPGLLPRHAGLWRSGAAPRPPRTRPGWPGCRSSR